MKLLNMNQNNMNCKKINKEYRKLISSPFYLASNYGDFKYGIIYTLYSDKFNLLEVGFAENISLLENKLLKNEFILLDKKKGKKKDLNLLINTLCEFGIKFSGNFSFKYSRILIRHLYTLGWPVGRSLYKHLKIKKELSCA